MFITAKSSSRGKRETASDYDYAFGKKNLKSKGI